MPDIPFTTDGFVDMDAFDATDPDALASLTELGAGDAGDVVPALGDDSWHSLLDDVFEGSVDTDLDVDALVGDDAGDDNPFEIEDVWGGGDDDVSDLADTGGAEATLDDDGEADVDEIDAEIDDLAVDEVEIDDTGAGVGELVDFGDDDLGSGVGDLVEFDDDGVGIEDDLDALENTDFDS